MFKTILGATLGKLEGKKRYLGILTMVASHLLYGLGWITPETRGVIDAIGGGVFGVGYVHAENRKIEVIKKQVPNQ